MTTARDIIRRAMLDVGVLTKGENPASDEANDALDTLNALIGSWSNISSNIFTRTKETFSLTSSATYTIGSGQTFDTTTPIQVVDAYVTNGTTDYPLIIVSQEAYNTISPKTSQGVPEYLTYNYAYPYGTITLYPVNSGATSITLLTEKPLTGFTTLDTDLSLPPGMERALVKNLAMELAPQYGQQITTALALAARNSINAIKLAVARSRPVDSFPRSRTLGNIYTGYWS